MRIPENIEKFKNLSDRLRIRTLTGSIGKAALRENSSPEYINRARKLVELSCLLKTYAHSAAGVISYKSREYVDDEARESLRSVMVDVRRRVCFLQQEIYALASGGSKQYLKKMPFSIENKNSSSTCTTVAAHIIRLAREIDNGRGDLLTVIAREVVELVVENYEQVIKGSRALDIVEINPKVSEWVDGLNYKDVGVDDFIASTKIEPFEIKGLTLSLFKRVIPVVATQEEADTTEHEAFLFQDIVHVKVDGNVEALV